LDGQRKQDGGDMDCGDTDSGGSDSGGSDSGNWDGRDSNVGNTGDGDCGMVMSEEAMN
jgi:hypothetical protein